MWREIVGFEVRYQLRQLWVPMAMALFFALGLGLASSNVGASLNDVSGTVLRDAPIVVARLMPVLSLLGLLVITAVLAGAALRDQDERCDMLFLTKPVSTRQYLGGRFLGALLVSLGVLTASVLGLLAGAFAPWQPTDQVGAVDLRAYLFGLAVIIVPNLLSMGGLVFALAVWSRRLTVTYLCVVAFIGLQDAVEILAQTLEARLMGSLLEPSGIVALETMSRYWTMAEQNGRLPELSGPLLANRLLWMALAAVALWGAMAKFEARGGKSPVNKSFMRLLRRTPEVPGTSPEVPGTSVGAAFSEVPGTSPEVPGTSVGAAFSEVPGTSPEVPGTSVGALRRWMRQLRLQTRLDLGEILPKTPFLALSGFGLMVIVAIAWQIGSHDGMPSYPLTELMLQAIAAGVRLTLVLILLLYAGELVFSQRSLQISQVYDALPVPNSVFLAAKVLALWTLTAVFLLAAAVLTLLVQLAKGYGSIDWGLYLQGLGIVAWPLLLISVMALFWQVLLDHKVLGLLAAALTLIVRFALPRLGFEDPLYLFASHPPIAWSGMDGYGHQAAPFVSSMVYWSFATGALYVLTLALWPRGTGSTLRHRVLALGRRLRGRPMVPLAVALLGMAGAGAWIVSKTHLQGGALSRQDLIQQLSDYEHHYHEHAEAPLPRITDVNVEVDIYPEDRRAEIRGSYRLENRGADPISRLPVSRSVRWVEGVLPLYGGVTLREVRFEADGVDVASTTSVADDDLGFYVYELGRPLEAGQSMDLHFAVSVDHRAYAHRRRNDLIVGNGTFFSSQNFLPTVGYATDNQLRSPQERRRHGLPPVQRTAPLDDIDAAQHNYLGADWIQFETLLSTSADQIALAPGRLVEDWQSEGRRFFRYRAEAPVIQLLPFLSGRYEVVRERWNEVDIEVYVDPDHAVNVERFVDITRRSLEYMTRILGPYPHDTLRIVEVPNYHGKVAFAFPQLIAFSESWGWNADLEGDVELDWLAAILSHEVAHQWWNHQVVPADVQGATLIAEALAQYSAMMILREMFGEAQVSRFLRFHLDRYLQGRSREPVREMPLALVENQDYVHYSKASLVFYALEDRLGEQVLNEALRDVLEAFRMAGPPYATSRHLMESLRGHAPAEAHPFIEDLFNHITLFDQRVTRATYEAMDDGTYSVQVETTSSKVWDDGLGNVEERPLDDWVDIGIFGEVIEGGKAVEVPLILEPRHVTSQQGHFQFIVQQQPVRAGIDPYFKLIDRDTSDNVRPVVRRVAADSHTASGDNHVDR